MIAVMFQILRRSSNLSALRTNYNRSLRTKNDCGLDQNDSSSSGGHIQPSEKETIQDLVDIIDSSEIEKKGGGALVDMFSSPEDCDKDHNESSSSGSLGGSSIS